MTLSELTEAADVSIRTVRYYIAEGLLPPPEGSGPASVYTTGHLDRLRLIQRLKEAYLPLKEIRRRTAGMDDDAVRAILSGEAIGEAAKNLPEASWDASLVDAREYLAMMESGERYRTEPMPLLSPPKPAPAQAAPIASAPGPEPARSRGPRAAGVFPSRRPPEREERASQPERGLWHRIPLGDEAELVISERVYARHRDRVDWLVRWARKVFN
jgi:DNA-binding transcriptional MerR regulator